MFWSRQFGFIAPRDVVSPRMIASVEHAAVRHAKPDGNTYAEAPVRSNASRDEADLSVSNLLASILSPIAPQTVAEMSQRRTKKRQMRSVP
jgi:hypothetical protein